MMKNGRATKYAIVEAVLLVGLLLAGVAIRIYQMPTEPYGLGTYFDVAAVGNNPVPYITGTGIRQIYLYMLRGLFTIFGNVWQVGTIAQLVLFMIGVMVFYFAIRKVNGCVGSLLIVGCVLCLPWFFLPITYMYGPQMLFFLLFGVGLYYTHTLVRDCENREELGIIIILQTIITGLYGGLLIYLDLFSVILVIPVMLVPFLMRKVGGAGKGTLVSLLWIISAVAAVFCCGLGEAMLAQLSVGEVMKQWLQNSYHQLFWDHRSVSYVSWETLLRDRHIWLGIIMAATYISVLVYFVIYLLFQRTTRTVRELDVEGLLMNQTEGPQENAAEQRAEMPASAVVSEKEVTAPVKEEVNEELNPAVRFIENPLPLPKKHVKKTLGYAFEPDFEDMDYDVKVSEKDDYDLT